MHLWGGSCRFFMCQGKAKMAPSWIDLRHKQTQCNQLNIQVNVFFRFCNYPLNNPVPKVSFDAVVCKHSCVEKCAIEFFFLSLFDWLCAHMAWGVTPRSSGTAHSRHALARMTSFFFVLVCWRPFLIIHPPQKVPLGLWRTTRCNKPSQTRCTKRLVPRAISFVSLQLWVTHRWSSHGILVVSHWLFTSHVVLWCRTTHQYPTQVGTCYVQSNWFCVIEKNYDALKWAQRTNDSAKFCSDTKLKSWMNR